MSAVKWMVAGTFSNFYLCFLANLGHVMNTKVVSNVMIHLLVKFHTHWTCIARALAKILLLCFLQSRNSREVEMDFFDHPNLWISTCIEYQSCSTWNYLASVKISKNFDEQNESYKFFRNGWHCTNCFTNTCGVRFRYTYVQCILEVIWIKLLKLNSYSSDSGINARHPRWFWRKW